MYSGITKKIIENTDYSHSSIKNTIIYNDEILNLKPKKPIIFKTKIVIQNKDTIGTCFDINLEKASSKYFNLTALNFASAKNPGGGFRNGSKGSQEESLCRSSGLYACLNTQYAYDKAYILSRQNANYGLYHHFVIYSPNVPVFIDMNGYWFDKPFSASFITCPAPNAKCALEKGISQTTITKVLKERIKAILIVAVSYRTTHLVLGAFGCGCFGNNPKEVAIIFKDYLENEFKDCFDTVYFPIMDDKIIKIFKDVGL